MAKNEKGKDYDEEFESIDPYNQQQQKEIGVGGDPPKPEEPAHAIEEVKKEETVKQDETEEEILKHVMDHETKKEGDGAPLREELIEKMKLQNTKLKKEFAELKDKLEECIAKTQKGKKQSLTSKPIPTEEELAREQEIRAMEQKIQYYKKQIQTMKKQLEGSFNIDKIVALENEEQAKKKIVSELEQEKSSLMKIQKDQKKAMEGMINEKDLKQKKESLKEEIKKKKADLKEKQNLIRKQEKQLKEQHEAIIKNESKCKRLQTLINEKKAGISTESAGSQKTEAELQALEAEIKELEGKQVEETKKYKQLITGQENKIKELTLQIETLNMELKQKDQECRLNTLKINELKRQVRLGALKQPAETPSGISKIPMNGSKEAKISKDVEQIKKDMRAEKDLEETSNNKKSEEGQLEGKGGEVEEDIPEEGKEEVKIPPLSLPLDKKAAEPATGAPPGVEKKEKHLASEERKGAEASPDDQAKEGQPQSSVFSKPNLGIGKKKK